MYFWDDSRSAFYSYEGPGYSGRKRFRKTIPDGTPASQLDISAARQIARMYSVLLNERAKEKSLQVKQRRLEEKAREREDSSGREMSRVIGLLAERSAVLADALAEIVQDPYMNDAVQHTMERSFEYASPLTAMLAGVAMNPAARAHLDRKMDESWEASRDGSAGSGEMAIVGAGLHAAVVSNVRAQQGKTKPRVFESGKRVGGAFAASLGPSFYLNSRNRPGKLSVPFDPTGALNVIPGSPIQPSDIDSGEYQSNDAISFCVRVSLALNAYVEMVDEPIARILQRSIVLPTKQFVSNRTIIATGLSETKAIDIPKSDRILTFAQFMAKMDEPFPFKGMDRVAVVGGGDSGRTAIEALLGQGPAPRTSSASLDWPSKIAWYGANGAESRRTWEQCNRSRYKGIARGLDVYTYFSNENEDGEEEEERVLLRKGRVEYQPRAGSFQVGYDSVMIAGVPYDYVVNCTGFVDQVAEGMIQFAYEEGAYKLGGMEVAKSYNGNRAFVVGPAAQLIPTTEERRLLAGINENITSMYRYVPRTAALAAALP